MASRLIQHFDGLARRTRAVAERNLKDVLTLMQSELKKTVGVQGSKTNRSKPGEPPRRQTGRLQREITTEIDVARLEGKVISGAPYSGYLQNGTPKMRPRPYFGVTYKRTHYKITEILQRRK